MRTQPIAFDDTVLPDAQTHARQEYPRESVGFIIEGKYVPQVNIAEEPEKEFKVDARKFVELGNVQAIIHSHPSGENYPNKTDMQGQLDTAVPWAILPITKQEGTGILACGEWVWWGDQLPVPPLVGRGFVHGICDCYALIRDYYRLTYGIILKEFPRDWAWWTNGERLYEEGFGQTGFKVANMSDPKPGDVFLAAIRSKTPSHGGIWLGGPASEILHHLTAFKPFEPTWLSRREPGVRYLKFVHSGGIWIRHKELM